MGGHGHGHHHAPYTVPKAEIYNNQVEKIRELNLLQNELAKRGLKDPWIRNDVWRYNRAVWGHSKPYRWVRTLFRGFPLGAALAAATIAYEEYYGVYKHHGHDDHAHGGGEHGAHH